MVTDVCNGKGKRDETCRENAQRQRKTRQLFAAAVRGIDRPVWLQVICPGAGRLDGQGTVVSLDRITMFRSQPVYDPVVFSFAEDCRPEPALLPVLQYCRMLLKPGGRLALLLPASVPPTPYDYFMCRLLPGRWARHRSDAAALLQSAGLTEVRHFVSMGSGRVIWGLRPVSR